MSELVKRLRERADDSGYHADFTAAADRIAELEASLADSNEALQVMGLKLAHAEGQNERAFQMLSAYGVPKERAKTVANGIDVLMMRMEKAGHSSNTVGGPTPVIDAAPASDHDKIVSWNWVLRSIENNPDHAVIISRTPVGLCFTHGNPVPELEDANELLRDALKELVELKDMKEILDANESTPLKVWSIEEEYRERKPKAWALARAVLNDTNPVMDAAPACERSQVIKECAAICTEFVSAWNQTSIDRLQAGRASDSLLWAGKADGAIACHGAIMGLIANCSNADTRTAGESDS